MRILKYVYYRLYMWDLRVGAKWGYSAELYAFAQLSFLVLLNIMGVLEAIDLFTAWHIDPFNVYGLGLLFAVGVAGYFLLIHRGKYHRFVKEFNAETATQRRIGSVGILVYIIISFALFFGLVVARRSL